MALVLVETAGAANANTYCALAESNSYHEAHVYGTTWIDGEDDVKKPALVWATRLLDEQVEWKGYIASLTQALRWPRSMVVDRDGQKFFDSATIPTFLKQATAELARHLLAGDRTQERSIGISSVVADTVEVVFDKHDVKPILPPSVVSLVQAYGTVIGPGSGTAKLVRV